MNDPAEPTCSSQLPTQLLSDQPALGFTSVRSLRLRAEFLAQDTMVPRQVLPTVPIRRANHVSVQCTLKLTSSPMQHVMESVSLVQRYTPPIPHAIRAHVFSLIREYQPWFSIVSIVTGPVSYF